MTIWDFIDKGYENQIFILILICAITVGAKLIVSEMYTDD